MPHRHGSALNPRAVTRLLLATAVLLVGAAVAGVSAPAASADGGVRVTINGGGARTISRADLVDNVDRAQERLTTRQTGSDGPRDETVVVHGMSAKRLVALAHVGLPALIDMSVTYDGYGTPVTLTADEVANGFSGDPEGHREAIFEPFRGDAEVQFFRPLRSSTDSSTDELAPSLRSDLLVDLHTTGHPLDVQIAPSATQIDPGQRVSFSAEVDPQPDGTVAYDWDFGDGETAQDAGPSTSHVYAATGRYTATVTATLSDGSSGADSTRITVGTPDAGGTSNTPSTPSTALGGGGAASGGGKTQSGSGAASPDAPSTGAAKRRKAAKSASARKRASAKRKSKQARDRSKRQTAKAAPPAVSLSGQPATPDARRQTRKPGAQQPAKTVKPPAARGSGVPIHGILLSGSSTLANALPAPESPLAASEDGTPGTSGSPGSPGGLLWWLAVGTACIAVLASGAAVENRLLARHTAQAA